MRAAVYRQCGPAEEVLRLEDLPRPHPAAGEVLVEVHASGINPADTKRRAGWGGMQIAHSCVTPHADGAGRIVDVGAGVDEARVGQRVWVYNAQGGYGETGRAFGTAAEYVALAEHQAVALTDSLSYDAGACLGIPAMTAHHAVFSDGPVAGKSVLVAGAGGAVGHFVVQFAVRGGAHVVGTAGTARIEHARLAGAATVVNRHEPDLTDALLAASSGDGFDRIVEVDFGANAEMDVALLRPHGTIAAFSSTSDPTPPLPYYGLQSKGGTLRTIQGFNIPPKARRLGEAAIDDLARAGHLIVAIGACLPLERIADGHCLVEAGMTIGNVVLKLR